MFPSKPLRPQLVNERIEISKRPHARRHSVTIRLMTDTGKLILRLAVAILLGFHGISKLTKGIAWMAGPLQGHHLPIFLSYGVYIAEVIAPLLLIIGVLTRPAALVIAFELSMALYLVLGAKTFAINPQTG